MNFSEASQPRITKGFANTWGLPTILRQIRMISTTSKPSPSTIAFGSAGCRDAKCPCHLLCTGLDYSLQTLVRMPHQLN
jgi:hypothetical protein